MNYISTAQGAPVESRLEQFHFTGKAGEYFGVWIVNVVLTILTLGIYSAWAKVRRERYFHGSTFLAGSSFEYHASPKQILIGRIIVFALFLAYNLIVTIFPLTAVVFLPLFLIAMPWFIVRGLRFNARVTSYRNVRFDFVGGYWGAFKAIFLASLVAVMSLGIMAPFASRWAWRYILDNLRYGGRPFDSDPRLGDLYRQWLLPAALTVLGFGLILVPAVLYRDAAIVLLAKNVAPDHIIGAYYAAIYGCLIALGLIYVVAGLLYRAGVHNVVLNATVLDGHHRFVSHLGRGRYAWIAITNFLATILTLGLARPWAAVRVARFIAAAAAIQVRGPLEDYLSTVSDTGTAVGSEFMEMEGISLGI
ncbi:membrane protein [Brucella endophytica]|uniref:Membrane protein n=1 Tax=Brucella endophytica TaxID=1963359 RepID=A0A916WK29_9HYPH|nr:DUF898 family protein [Brucella endophytica]GGB05334.1 membrane protein [Brucella endophytica]